MRGTFVAQTVGMNKDNSPSIDVPRRRDEPTDNPDSSEPPSSNSQEREHISDRENENRDRKNDEQKEKNEDEEFD